MPALPRAARPTVALLLLAALVAVPSAGQLAPLTVPKGLTRVEGFWGFATWDRRFHDGRDEPLAQDFIRDTLGSNFFPALTPADELLRRVTGIATARLNLGATSATQLVTVGSAGIGLAYGLTSRITVFGRVPIHRVRVRASLSVDSTTSGAGLNPADPVFGNGAGVAQSGIFFAQFELALAQLQQNLDAGQYNSDPALRALAQQTLADGRALRDDLHQLIFSVGTASPFLPTASSAEGTALLGRIAQLQTTLSGPLGITGFTGSPALPAQRLSSEDLSGFLTNPDGPVAGILDSPILWRIGDMEAGVAFLLIETLNEAERRSGIRVAGQGLVRFYTGQLDRPEAFFDVGTGDFQPDVDLSLLADAVLPWGGARFEAGYNLQLARAIRRRIAPPSVPTPYAATEAAVSRNPGDVLSLGVTPFLRLAPTFALRGGVHYSRRTQDRIVLLAGQQLPPGLEPSVLAEDSEASWVQWSAGISYRSPLRVVAGRRRMPLDAGVTLSGVAAGSGGRVSKSLTVGGFLRLYTSFP
jgi:hypothetical protein